MTLTVELAPEMVRQLQTAAARRGQTVAEYAREMIEQSVASTSDAAPTDPAPDALFAGIRRRTVAELAAMARAQGARPVERFEELLGDFWPADESVDEFLAARRRWQWEGRPAASRRRTKRPQAKGGDS